MKDMKLVNKVTNWTLQE